MAYTRIWLSAAHSVGVESAPRVRLYLRHAVVVIQIQPPTIAKRDIIAATRDARKTVTVAYVGRMQESVVLSAEDALRPWFSAFFKSGSVFTIRIGFNSRRLHQIVLHVLADIYWIFYHLARAPNPVIFVQGPVQCT